MSRFVLITPNTDFDSRVRQALAGGLPGGLQTFAFVNPADPGELFANLNQERPEVLILGPDIPVEDALRLATVFDVQLPELSVVLVGEPDPAFVLLAMRAGHPGHPQPGVGSGPDPDAAGAGLPVVSPAGTGPRPSSQAESAKGLVIGVFSPKGGVGKTTIATNIAIGLGKVAPMGVVIVDLDLQFGDVASGLYLNPEHTVTDAVSAAASQDSLVLKAFLTVHPSNIYALCAPRTPGGGRRHHPAAGHPAPGAARGTVPVRRGGHRPRPARGGAGRHGTVHRRRLGHRHGRPEYPRAALRPRHPPPAGPAPGDPARGPEHGRLQVRPQRPGRRGHHRRARGCQHPPVQGRRVLHQPRHSGPAGRPQGPGRQGTQAAGRHGSIPPGAPPRKRSCTAGWWSE